MTREVRTGPKSGARQEWRTPRVLATAIVRRFAVTVDVAARRDNSIAPAFIGPPDEPTIRLGSQEGRPQMIAADALAVTTSWKFAGFDCPAGTRPVAFVNPPFSMLLAFALKAIAEAARGTSVVLLGPANPDTRWFAAMVDAGATLYLFRGRVRFEPPPVDGAAVQEKHGPAFPSVCFHLRGLAPARQPGTAPAVYVVHPATFEVL